MLYCVKVTSGLVDSMRGVSNPPIALLAAHRAVARHVQFVEAEELAACISLYHKNDKPP